MLELIVILVDSVTVVEEVEEDIESATEGVSITTYVLLVPVSDEPDTGIVG